ncbi:MAG: hypothetical protein BWK73_01860 [Thiothrix lacustris]|uniref:Uncharacterized protein n=1 Tax=Thiothrix lacustris TaxID=525917 RepID=A0A1Y1QZX2_9GAMM|nr:MAG: hypothetical protein BWK73_01860 [Thiothrix lacustris]
MKLSAKPFDLLGPIHIFATLAGPLPTPGLPTLAVLIAATVLSKSRELLGHPEVVTMQPRKPQLQERVRLCWWQEKPKPAARCQDCSPVACKIEARLLGRDTEWYLIHLLSLVTGGNDLRHPQI